MFAARKWLPSEIGRRVSLSMTAPNLDIFLPAPKERSHTRLFFEKIRCAALDRFNHKRNVCAPGDNTDRRRVILGVESFEDVHARQARREHVNHRTNRYTFSGSRNERRPLAEGRHPIARSDKLN